MPGVRAGNWLPVDRRRFALGHFFLGLPISFAVAEAILNFSGKLVSFDIARFPSTILAFENIFTFCHLENLLILQKIVLTHISPTAPSCFRLRNFNENCVKFSLLL